jgi:hypothetical protein
MSGDRPSKLVTCNSIRNYCASGSGSVGPDEPTLPFHWHLVLGFTFPGTFDARLITLKGI